MLGDDQGLWISNDLGTSWSVLNGSSNLNNTLSLTEAYRIAASPDDQNITLGVEDASFFNKQTGTVWTDAELGYDGTTVVGSRYNSQVFLGVQGAYAPDNILASWDGGVSWTHQPDLSWGYWDKNEDWIAPITQYPSTNSPNTFYSPRRHNLPDSNARVYIDINVTNDNGNSWTPNPYPITHIPTGSTEQSPQTLTFSEADPTLNTIYVSTWSYFEPNAGSQLYKSTDGGRSWSPPGGIPIHSHGVPNRKITSVVCDPAPGYQNVVYLTLSGYNGPFDQGHVFKSIDGGNSWSFIDEIPTDQGSGLPNMPVNNMILRKMSSCEDANQLIVASDGGVYETIDLNCHGVISLDHWSVLSSGLPPCQCMGLDFNTTTNMLRTTAFGRGAYQIQLSGAWYITNNQCIYGSTQAINFADTIIIASGGTLTIPQGCTINMPADKKIIIQDGGTFVSETSSPVTFTSQSGTWGGIEVDGNATINLQNCVFDNCDSAITINGNPSSLNTPSVNISGCTFNSCSIISAGCDSVTISGCTFNGASATTGTAISIVYGNNILIGKNRIHDAAIGISVSNSSPVVIYNTIDIVNNSPQNAVAGISMNNSYSSIVNENTITGFINGIYLNYSSPSMLSNTVVNTNNAQGDSIMTSALYATFLSSPWLAPSSGNSTTIIDAGSNTFRSDNIGDAVYIYDQSEPVVDQGYNIFNGQQYDFDGSINSDGIGLGTGNLIYYATYNCWINQFTSNVSDATFVTDPTSCTPIGNGGGESGNDPKVTSKSEIDNPNSEVDAPPPPIIVNYGHGIYDTIKVVNHQLNVPANYVLFSQAVSNERSGQYQQAVSIYQQIIQNYPDSALTVTALKRLMYCNDKLNINQNAYAQLRSYYQTLAQNHSNDTALVKTAKELASKCLEGRNLIHRR